MTQSLGVVIHLLEGMGVAAYVIRPRISKELRAKSSQLNGKGESFYARALE